MSVSATNTFAATSHAGDCRARLLQAAGEVFAAEGYRASSVDRIAELAGVVKQTLYNHFPSKADLFGEVIRLAVHDLMVSLDDGDLDLRERLCRFGVRYREKLLSPVGLGFYRAMVAETVRFPELAVTFYRSGPAQTTVRLCGVFEAAMRLGELRCIDPKFDPEFAATTLLSMLVGAERSRYLFSGEPVLPPDPADAERIVDCFLRAFAA